VSVLPEMPSLSTCLDKYLECEVVPGVVDTVDYRYFADFSIHSEDYAKMTADEIFLGYFQPALKEIASRINALDAPVCTRAMNLPGAGEPVAGFRCWKGRIPVNVYIMRLQGPDRHRFMIDTIVKPMPEEVSDGEA